MTAEPATAKMDDDATVTSNTQTRFSFYNAKDYVVKPADQQQQQQHEPPPSNRFHFYNAQEIAPVVLNQQKQEATSTGTATSTNSSSVVAVDQQMTAATSAAVPQQQQQQQQQRPKADEQRPQSATKTTTTAAASDTTADNNVSGVDSVEILRSLQEHEQQRLEILGGEPTSSSHSREVPTSAPASAATSSSAAPTSSNPYEDAIKEALELLRKHRSGNSPQEELPNEATSDGGASRRPSALDTRFAAPRYSPPSSSMMIGNSDAAAASNASHPHLNEESMAPMIKTPPEEDLLLQSRHHWDSDTGSSAAAGTSAATSSHGSSMLASLLTPTAETPSAAVAAAAAAAAAAVVSTPSEATSGATSASTPTEGILGEAYQAEIEARRKQRQERMARYASRLAELKKDGNNNNDDKDSAVDTTSEPSPVHQQHQLPLQEGQPRSSSAAARTKLFNGPSAAASPSSGSDIWHDTRQSPNRFPHPAIAVSSPSQKSQQDDEVQRGVERVLLAILERANNSRGRAAAAAVVAAGTNNYRQPEEEKKSGTECETSSPRSSGKAAIPDHHHDHNMSVNHQEPASPSPSDDALLRAMSDLLRQAPSIQDSASELDLLHHHHHHPHHHHHHHHDGGDASHATQDSGTLAAAATNEDLRQVASDPEAHQELDRMVERIFSAKGDGDAPATAVAAADVAAAVAALVVNDDDDDDDDGLTDLFNSKSVGDDEEASGTSEEGVENLETRGPTSGQSNNTMTERSREKSGSEEYTDNDSGDEFTEDDSEESELVGSSSYEEGDSETDTEGRSDVLNGVLGPLSMMAGGTTGVVLEADSSEEESPESGPASASILDSISTVAMNLVGVNSSPTNDPRYIGSNDDDDESSTSSSEESETRELTRTLCAHIFPKDMPDREKLQSRIPRWDESNPDEPGYRIIRLNSYQLKSVQLEFDYLIREWRRKLGGSKTPLDPLEDESFERDLKEAEDLLDREERRAAMAGKVDVAAEPAEGHNGVRTAATVEPAAHLAHFPGVRPAGRGEMGDLEYFHLPVIFKSHVTGFEPTKDLHLEAGNVVAGQYLVEGELGSAAFSTAYRCVDLSSEGDGPDGHDEVCLKVIKNTKDFFDQSLDEIKILELLRQTGQCNENHILEMKTFFYHREHLIIVTELLRQNLFEFGKFIIDNDEEPYFTIPRLSYITRQVLIAMKFIHNIGLVHSDVKPENILLSSYSRAQVKLIDFGSSCYLTDRQSSYIQSRSYRAPEVVLGLPYDGKIDIWSLGCVVAEMFTGEVTFQNDSVVSMLSRIEGICGKTPTHMIEQGRQSGAFFSSCGLLFEKIEKKSKGDGGDPDDDDDGRTPSSYDIFQPKRTTLAARLGFERDLMERFDAGLQLSREQKKRAVFVDFVRCLLTIDPDNRPNAEEALKHPWMEYAAELTEADIKYPSE